MPASATSTALSEMAEATVQPKPSSRARSATRLASARPLVVSPGPEAVSVTVYRNPNRGSADQIELAWLEGTLVPRVGERIVAWRTGLEGQHDIAVVGLVLVVADRACVRLEHPQVAAGLLQIGGEQFQADGMVAARQLLKIMDAGQIMRDTLR